MYQAVLADAKFHEQLLAFDRDLAASARAARCRLCGGALHSGSYDRKPRGGPTGLGQEYAERFSFCCAVDGCRTRATPPSLRFLGRHVYLATVVTLISAMQFGITPGGLTIRDRIQERSGREPSVGAIYTALERLERKGFVSSWWGEPTEERGGRRKRSTRSKGQDNSQPVASKHASHPSAPPHQPGAKCE